MHIRVVALGLVAAIALTLAAAVPLTGRTWEQALSELSGATRTMLGVGSSETKTAAQASSATPAKPQGPPPTVTVSQPIAREIVEWDEYTGRFEAVEAVDIRARISGYLTELHFKDGQNVTKGDLLFVIDPRPFERAVGLASAELEQAKVRVRNASLDVERGRPLLERSVISEKVFDDRENLVRDAEASVKITEERLKNAELELSFTRIMAPISGRIGRTNVTTGNFVSGGTEAATSLLSIVSQNPIYLYFDVNENNAIKYKRLGEALNTTSRDGLLGAEVEIALPDETGFPHRAKLDFVDNRLDLGTGTLKARAVVTNDGGLFSPGMFSRVRLQGSPKSMALLLPDDAIGTDQTSRYVWVVDDYGQPERRRLMLGPLSEGLRVVRSGLQDSDWVVVNGQQRIRRGQPVTAKREPLAVSAAAPTAAGLAPLVRTP